MAKSSSISSSLSEASNKASVSLSVASKSASSALSSGSAKASAAAADAMNKAPESSKIYTGLTVVAIILTVLAVAVGGLYFSGYADDFFVYFVERFYKAKAKAEEKALEQAGEGQAQDFLKGQLKKNPLMGEDELNQVQSGLGSEAAREGLGGVSSKLGGLGKF